MLYRVSYEVGSVRFVTAVIRGFNGIKSTDLIA